MSQSDILDQQISAPIKRLQTAQANAAGNKWYNDVMNTGNTPIKPGAKGGSTLSNAEIMAGVTPPSYEGYRNADGTLKSAFTFDPTQSSAFNTINQNANSAGPSQWAQMQTQAQKLATNQQMDQAAKSSMQGQDMAASNLARVGGLGGGARTRLAMQGAKDLMMQRQGVDQTGQAAQLGIMSQDAQNKQQMLNNVAQTQLGSQQQNLSTAAGDVTNKAQFDANRYNQQMQAWGSQQTANATRAAGSGGGKK